MVSVREASLERMRVEVRAAEQRSGSFFKTTSETSARIARAEFYSAARIYIANEISLPPSRCLQEARDRLLRRSPVLFLQ